MRTLDDWIEVKEASTKLAILLFMSIGLIQLRKLIKKLFCLLYSKLFVTKYPSPSPPSPHTHTRTRTQSTHSTQTTNERNKLCETTTQTDIEALVSAAAAAAVCASTSIDKNLLLSRRKKCCKGCCAHLLK